jgi:hypothetical protein
MTVNDCRIVVNLTNEMTSLRMAARSIDSNYEHVLTEPIRIGSSREEESMRVKLPGYLVKSVVEERIGLILAELKARGVEE